MAKIRSASQPSAKFSSGWNLSSLKLGAAQLIQSRSIRFDENITNFYRYFT